MIVLGVNSVDLLHVNVESYVFCYLLPILNFRQTFALTLYHT